MNQKLQTRAFEQIAHLLQPGEQPVAATRAQVGSFSSSRLGSVMKQALIMEAGGALGAALVNTGRQFVVVTTHRMIFLSQSFLGGPGKRVLGEMPRQHVAVAEVKMGIVSLVRIAFGNAGDGIALTFPRVDKKNAEALVAALQRAFIH
ncbi:hypothetical protein [Actinoplanes regularis]|uniref:hypothetical protein n=1 Tax=Actinoplanes regularis TaxID=52697 RepID=UPI0024A00286|nr:hypothetical protein [Actinoplanes regularis]GLW32610.1 hypothetical protein Areg01_55480 [Actinoplanes regularis]